MLYLASKSPRRHELLLQLGIKHKILSADIPEQHALNESAQDYVKRIALEKAQTVAALIGDQAPVLAADTEVVLDDKVLGKPRNREHAITMLMSLSERTHIVYSAVALIHKKEYIVLNTNHVYFKPLTQQECEAYCDSDEPYDKAGGYAIQGKAAAFISHMEGSYSGVMGLPLYETAQLLQQAGLLINDK